MVLHTLYRSQFELRIFFVRLKIPDFQLIFQCEKIHLKRNNGSDEKTKTEIQLKECKDFILLIRVSRILLAYTHTLRLFLTNLPCLRQNASRTIARIIPIKNENHSFPLKLKHIGDAIREMFIALVVAAQKD